MKLDAIAFVAGVAGFVLGATAVPRAERGLELGQDHQPAAPRSLDSVFKANVFAQSPLEQLTVYKGHLPRNMRKAAMHHYRHVARHRCGRFRQCNAQCLQACFNAHFTSLSISSSSHGTASTQRSIRACA